MILETYEWTHFWWERSEQKTGRVLVVGDSICNGYGEKVQKNLGTIPVDRFSTSFSIDNPSLKTELKIFLEDMGLEYSVVHFNNGLHGQHITVPEYARLYEELLKYIIGAAGKAVVMIASSTPVTTTDKKGYNPFNADVLKRNAVVAELAEKYGLPFDDLYSVADGRPELYSGDGYHYNADGWEVLGKSVSDFISAHSQLKG